MEPLKKMPVGVQHFRGIREQGKMYVDKTQLIHQLLIPEGKYFLSRPRRFGKSLTLDTIAHCYGGEDSADLFKGLWMDGKWDFAKMRRPVLRFDFTQITSDGGRFKDTLLALLHKIASGFDLTLESGDIRELQNELVTKIHAAHGKVVVLVDEYDKPITAHLENDLALSLANRDLLREFFGPMKALGDKIELLFITGIARFTKTSLFSDLNHLQDLSMDEKAAALCGVTQVELERDFEPYFPELQTKLELDRTQLLNKLKEWYNGYRFHKNGPSVYNPFSLINFVSSKEFGSYWHLSGMPKFMRPFFRPGELHDFEGEEIDETGLQSFDIEALEVVPLMFQTGYLTIGHYDPELQSYTLRYPNQEVKDAFLSFYLRCQSGSSETALHRLITDLKKVFYRKEYEHLKDRLNNLMSILTYDMTKVDDERIYRGLVHIAFSLVGMHTECELHTTHGHCDMMIRAGGVVHLIEFKFGHTAQKALDQIKDRDYARKWLASGQPVKVWGINVDVNGKCVDEVLSE